MGKMHTEANTHACTHMRNECQISKENGHIWLYKSLYL